MHTFTLAVEDPSSFGKFIEELRTQFGLGVTGHVMIAVREFLSLSNFSMFTRDYVRRCCDLVEYFVKSRLACRAGVRIQHKPLGTVLKMLRRRMNGIPAELLDNLEAFNSKIYCPAKHDFSQKENEYKYNVPDAIAITFISIWLCKEIDQLCRRIPFG
jgi:hypothetical protein